MTATVFWPGTRLAIGKQMENPENPIQGDAIAQHRGEYPSELAGFLWPSLFDLLEIEATA